jgi:hypothetical protein
MKKISLCNLFPDTQKNGYLDLINGGSLIMPDYLLERLTWGVTRAYIIYFNLLHKKNNLIFLLYFKIQRFQNSKIRQFDGAVVGETLRRYVS